MPFFCPWDVDWAWSQEGLIFTQVVNMIVNLVQCSLALTQLLLGKVWMRDASVSAAPRRLWHICSRAVCWCLARLRLKIQGQRAVRASCCNSVSKSGGHWPLTVLRGQGKGTHRETTLTCKPFRQWVFLLHLYSWWDTCYGKFLLHMPLCLGPRLGESRQIWDFPPNRFSFGGNVVSSVSEQRKTKANISE